MATLINGNGNPRIYAAQDADLIAALAGDITGIAQIGNKFAATAVDANTISVADGVIVTKEGRRIQLDAGSTDMFVIPTGTTGVTNYYIIGYKLTTQSDDSQIAETFVQLMSSSSETITEDTFRSGATDVYVSLYRVQQDGVNLGTITGLLPELTNISELKSDLTQMSTPITAEFRNGTYSSTTEQISDAITLSEGTYLVIVKLPIATDTTYSVTDGSVILDRSFINGGTYTSIVFPYVVPSGGKTLHVQLSATVECSISYKERGYFGAIKLG